MVPGCFTILPSVRNEPALSWDNPDRPVSNRKYLGTEPEFAACFVNDQKVHVPIGW